MPEAIGTWCAWKVWIPHAVLNKMAYLILMYPYGVGINIPILYVGLSSYNWQIIKSPYEITKIIDI